MFTLFIAAGLPSLLYRVLLILSQKSAKKAKYAHTSSSSSSSSDSESDISSDGPPIRKPIGRKPPHLLPFTVTSNEHHVPPGQGSHQTRSRNLRRRVKKQHEQGLPFETPPPPPKNLSTTNLQPLGEPNGDSALNLSMFSLGNKNKKKDEPSSSISTPKSAHTPSFPFNQQRLIPPSERESLPSNSFVTSVDVEAGMWGKTRKNKRKTKDESAAYVEEYALDVEMANENVSLNYGDPAPSPEELLWKDAEALFDSKAPAASTDVQVGGVLAWKELALNTATYSPEIMLTLARVVALAEDGCTVRKLARPGFEDAEEEPLDETLSFGDIVAQSMRFIAGSAS
ncbi:hypothetical protein CPB85DRAFT_1436433 [Mucidula mucida]|nr:hypothetical protein CPB85DRAFT_1436433 [Mucidula mucida]